MTRLTRLTHVLAGCLLVMSLNLTVGCDWVVSQETLDLSGFQEFEFHGTIAGPVTVTISKAGDTYSALVWVTSNNVVTTSWGLDLTADDVSKMKDIFSRVTQEEHASIGETCPPTGAFRTFRWDDLTLSYPGNGKCNGMRVAIGEDSFTEILNFLAGLVGVYHPL